MFKVGLTGNYFSGLEDVAEVFKRFNIPVFEADLIVRFFLYNNSETITKIKNEFGKSVFTDNQIDLNKFGDTDGFKKLLAVIELDLLKAYEKWRQKNQKSKFTIFKSSIIFEAGWNESMNFNISVFKPNGVRINEIQRHFKMKLTDVYKMIDTEMDVFQKNRLCEYVIHNYNTYADSVEKQINSITKSIKDKATSSIIY
jgi:dephospho-CoA kinase